jgi:hypothetical protein
MTKLAGVTNRLAKSRQKASKSLGTHMVFSYGFPMKQRLDDVPPFTLIQVQIRNAPSQASYPSLARRKGRPCVLVSFGSGHVLSTAPPFDAFQTS